MGTGDWHDWLTFPAEAVGGHQSRQPKLDPLDAVVVVFGTLTTAPRAPLGQRRPIERLPYLHLGAVINACYLPQLVS